MELIKIGILTSGGDAPGMNACIRALTKYALSYNYKVVGFIDGFEGLIDDHFVDVTYEMVNNIIHTGGTILGTARSERFMEKSYREKAFAVAKSHQLQVLIVVGGDGSFRGALQLMNDFDFPVLGIPGTIDNDIQGTNYTIGFDTCLNTVVEAIDKIRDTATSHHRIFFVEVMGRNAGKIALNAAISAGADSVLIPEEYTSVEEITQKVLSDNRGKRSSIVVVAEGDELGGAQRIAHAVQQLLPQFNIRYSVLGHIQRGGSPSPFDRMVATQMGAFAIESFRNGFRGKFVALNNGNLELADLETSLNKKVPLNTHKIELLSRMRTLKK